MQLTQSGNLRFRADQPPQLHENQRQLCCRTKAPRRSAMIRARTMLRSEKNYMLFEVSAVEIGQHFYWNLNGFLVHGQVLMNTWIVIGILVLGSILMTQNLQSTLVTETNFSSGQNFIEFVLEFIRDIAKTQISHESVKWVPFLGTLFLFIFVSNWSGALIPWKIFELPNGELGAPTNDINTTVALALLTSVAYFYAGLTKKGLNYFGRYVQPTPILFPINVLEDFTKPLSFVVAVLITLVPLVIPIPLIFLGLFTSAIQALIFATLAGAYIGEAMETHH